MNKKEDILNMSLEELKAELAGTQIPRYRAGQVFTWLYKKHAARFELMTDLPVPLRKKLEEKYSIGSFKLAEHLISADKSEKMLFALEDGHNIETVLIPAPNRLTACLSSQVGCKFHCVFCASGLKGFTRNLSPSEIIGQILFVLRNVKLAITNYVFMGMGEPLDNRRNVFKAIDIMTDPAGMNIGARRITISTSGIIPGIMAMKSLRGRVNLSVSLHAGNDRLRGFLMPVNKKYPLSDLIRACKEYKSKTGRFITIEYVLMKGLNDGPGCAEGLSRIARTLRAKVNLIPYSDVEGVRLMPPEKDDIRLFLKQLKKQRVSAIVRESRGADIGAACGQLAGQAKVLYS